jgi:hypothetical protein
MHIADLRGPGSRDLCFLLWLYYNALCTEVLAFLCFGCAFCSHLLQAAPVVTCHSPASLLHYPPSLPTQHAVYVSVWHLCECISSSALTVSACLSVLLALAQLQCLAY